MSQPYLKISDVELLVHLNILDFDEAKRTILSRILYFYSRFDARCESLQSKVISGRINTYTRDELQLIHKACKHGIASKVGHPVNPPSADKEPGEEHPMAKPLAYNLAQIIDELSNYEVWRRVKGPEKEEDE